MKQGERILSPEGKKEPGWRRSASDSLLAIAGVALLTGVIAAAHLYPRIPSISLTYLLVIVALAGTRGRYAAILGALLASFSFDFLLASPFHTFGFTKLEDLLDPLVFLAAAILTGSLTATLRRRAEQARSRERETRLLSKQAQELASFQERQRLALELHDSVSQTLYGISLGAHTAREALESDPGEAIAPLDYVISLAEAGLAEMRALHNIVKHARATTVLLHLGRQDDELVLEVRDDGRGFDPTAPFTGHLGLRSIHEHVAHLGGTCSIESTPAQGTYLWVRIPTHEESESAVEAGERHA
jgi:signal transduction histidine kinase